MSKIPSTSMKALAGRLNSCQPVNGMYGQHLSDELIFVFDTERPHHARLKVLFRDYMELDREIDRIYEASDKKVSKISAISGLIGTLLISALLIFLLYDYFMTHEGSPGMAYVLGIMLGGLLGFSAVGLPFYYGMRKKFSKNSCEQIDRVVQRMEMIKREAAQYL